MVVVFLLLIALGVIGFFYDPQIVLFVASLRQPILDIFFITVTQFYTIAITLLLFILYSYYKKKDLNKADPNKGRKNYKTIKQIACILFSCLIAYGVAHVLKIMLLRPRPFEALNLVSLISATSNGSFPSGHSAIVFAALPWIENKKVLWATFAIIVAFSRLYLGVHYLSDVVFGGLFGYTISLLVGKIKWFQN